MPSADWFLPLFYALVGALVLFVCLQLWQALQHWFAQKRRARSSSAATTIHVQVERRASSPAPDYQWLWNTLTPREKEIARLVAQGKRNAEIAQELTLSVQTVETHLKHMFRKLQINSRTQLGRIVRDQAE